VSLSAWSAPVRLYAAGESRRQQGQRREIDLAAEFKQQEVIPVLDVLREYCKSSRPSLISQLNSVEIVVPKQIGAEANASAYRWGRSDIVTINYPLLLDFMTLAELVAVFATQHPAAESVYNNTVAYYESFLRNVRSANLGVEPFIIHKNVEDNISDVLAVGSIYEIGKIVRRDIVAWAVLHEISHHILGHTAINTDGLSLSENRKLELEADVSSFGMLNDLGLSLTNLRAFFQLRARLEPLLIKLGREPQEDKSDHPSWATRFRALESYIEKHPPPKSPWVAFGGDKFIEDERVPGTYRLTSVHCIFPTDPDVWGNLAFDAIWENSMGFNVSAAAPSLYTNAVSLENGQAHLYSRDDVFLIENIIENPLSHSSRTIFAITTVSDGKRHTAISVEPRDSAFRWRPGGSVGGVSLSEFQSSPPKDTLLRIARSIVRDPTILQTVEQSINELIRSDGAALLDYMKGLSTKAQYSEAIRLSYGTLAKDLTTLVGEEDSARFLSLVLESPYCEARGIRRELELSR
jgi:hypothetical protein